MTNTANQLELSSNISKGAAVAEVKNMIAQLGYDIVEENITKPWGAYFRIADTQAEKFIDEFFTGLTLLDAKLGREDNLISPKFLLVSPGQQLSWQYHDRRAERWKFLSDGAYYASGSDDQGDCKSAQAGCVVQFAQGERHRLCASDDASYTLVAEIWQHVDPSYPSDESDIVRLDDDYDRAA